MILPHNISHNPYTVYICRLIKCFETIINHHPATTHKILLGYIRT